MVPLPTAVRCSSGITGRSGSPEIGEAVTRAIGGFDSLPQAAAGGLTAIPDRVSDHWWLRRQRAIQILLWFVFLATKNHCSSSSHVIDAGSAGSGAINLSLNGGKRASFLIQAGSSYAKRQRCTRDPVGCSILGRHTGSPHGVPLEASGDGSSQLWRWPHAAGGSLQGPDCRRPPAGSASLPDIFWLEEQKREN